MCPVGGATIIIWSSGSALWIWLPNKHRELEDGWVTLGCGVVNMCTCVMLFVLKCVMVFVLRCDGICAEVCDGVCVKVCDGVCVKVCDVFIYTVFVKLIAAM